MDFPREELLEKYIYLYEQYVAPYEPDFEAAGGTTRYIKFNDDWYGLNPYNKFLITRLENRKNIFPKKTLDKISPKANPDNYVTLKYDSDGNLKMAFVATMVFVYVSKQLTIGYFIDPASDGPVKYDHYNFEWNEYDDEGRLVSTEEFRGYGTPNDDVIINCEYYEYDGNVLSHAWCFKDFQRFPIEATINMVRQLMPDRIFNPDKYEYSFKRVEDGLDYTCNRYYRLSQTLTDEGHVSEEKLSNLAENGIHLV